MRLGRERKMEEQERERAVAEAEDWTNSTDRLHGMGQCFPVYLPHLISKTALLWILLSFYRWRKPLQRECSWLTVLKIQPSTALGFHFKVEGARSALRTEHVGTT